MYYEHEKDELDSFTVGEPYFGRYGSGKSDFATSYKKRVKEKISDKFFRKRNFRC